MPRPRRRVGPPTDVHELRRGALLRLVQEPSREQARPQGGTSDRALDGAGRGLALVLRRRGLYRAGALTARAGYFWPNVTMSAMIKNETTKIGIASAAKTMWSCCRYCGSGLCGAGAS